MPSYKLNDVQPSRHPSAWIAPSADIVGDVRLGEGTSVWFGAVIRADNTPIFLGNGSNIQEGAMLHSDPGVPLTIGQDVTVGHHAILHGCTIGDNVLIGMGATVLNRAVIAASCLVGAGTLVTEGQEFPEGTLILGVPARAKRLLSAEEICSLRLSARSYRDKARLFSTNLARID